MAKAEPRQNRRYVDRPASALKTGDIFSLDDGATYHECAVNLSHTGTIAVVVESGQTVRIPCEADQICTVQVDYVKVRVLLPLEVDIAAWNEIYDVGGHPDDVRADVKRYFNPPNLIPAHLADIVRVAN